MARNTDHATDPVQAILTRALRRYVGMGKDWTPATLAPATGIDERTIRAYCEGAACPSLGKLVRLATVLGADFLNQVFEPFGFGGIERLEPDAITVLQVNALVAALTAKVAEDLADDGRIDHREEAEIEALIRKAHDLMGDYIARRTRRVA